MELEVKQDEMEDAYRSLAEKNMDMFEMQSKIQSLESNFSQMTEMYQREVSGKKLVEVDL
jgi:hypothetical protein